MGGGGGIEDLLESVFELDLAGRVGEFVSGDVAEVAGAGREDDVTARRIGREPCGGRQLGRGRHVLF